MRLVGASFTGGADRLDEGYFRELMEQATALLRGEGLPPGEADEYRARLLAGFRWILVDEYQEHWTGPVRPDFRPGGPDPGRGG